MGWAAPLRERLADLPLIGAKGGGESLPTAAEALDRDQGSSLAFGYPKRPASHMHCGR